MRHTVKLLRRKKRMKQLRAIARRYDIPPFLSNDGVRTPASETTHHERPTMRIHTTRGEIYVYADGHSLNFRKPENHQHLRCNAAAPD